MADERSLRRLELALAALGLTAALMVLLTALDAVLFHAEALARAVSELQLGAIGPGGVAFLGLVAVNAAVLIAAGRSFTRQIRGQRALLRRLAVQGERVVDGCHIVVVSDPRPLAFCAGFSRPRIFVSDATLRLLGPDELRALVAHEAHHAARRDPLRLLLAGPLAAAFSALPPLRSLRRREAALAELAADAAAVRAIGDPRPLAAALLAFGGEGPASGVGIAPVRVDHLLGDAHTNDVPRGLLVVAGLVVAALVLLLLRMAIWPGHPETPAGATLCTIATIAALVPLAGPAWLAARHVNRTLEPVA